MSQTTNINIPNSFALKIGNIIDIISFNILMIYLTDIIRRFIRYDFVTILKFGIMNQ